MSNKFTPKNVLEPVIEEGHKCEYCGAIVNSNEEYLKHIVDEHWSEFIKDILNKEV
tara:strand:+ start:316 stop:483 length:168 start_codon:yes stop_codon:yes gene_type:complete